MNNNHATEPQVNHEQKIARPTGVTLTTILLILSGLYILFVQLGNIDFLTELSYSLGMPGYYILGSLSMLGLLSVAAGIGSWLGKKWGWWLALFYFAYGICRNVNTMGNLTILYNYYGWNADGIVGSYFKNVIGILWNCVFLSYLTKPHVLQFHQLVSIKKNKAMLIVFGIGIALFIIGSFA